MRRAEAIAASTMGMLAAYQSVINDGGNPEALNVIATNTLNAFPLIAKATDEEAKNYVSGLKGNVLAEKPSTKRCSARRTAIRSTSGT